MEADTPATTEYTYHAIMTMTSNHSNVTNEFVIFGSSATSIIEQFNSRVESDTSGNWGYYLPHEVYEVAHKEQTT